MRILLPAALLLAACASTHVTFERHPSQKSSLWSLDAGGEVVEVRAEGRDTFVAWRNRTLLFPGFDSFRGTIRRRSVDLLGPKLTVRVGEDGVHVASGVVESFHPLEVLPEGEISVWRDGRFVRG